MKYYIGSIPEVSNLGIAFIPISTFAGSMSGRVSKINWIVVDISVSIPGLWICGAWYNSVRLQPAVKITVVIPRVVKIQPQLRLADLPGVLPVGAHRSAARLTPGGVLLLRSQRAIFCGRDRRAAVDLLRPIPVGVITEAQLPFTLFIPAIVSAGHHGEIIDIFSIDSAVIRHV